MADDPLEQSIRQAALHHRSGRLAEAEAIYRQIAREKPDHPIVIHYLGVVCHQTGRRAEAFELLQRAIRLRPNYAEAYYNLGNIFVGERRWDEAIAAFEKAIECQPNYATALINLGNTYIRKGELDLAIAACRRAVALNPKIAQGHNNLGTALQMKGESAEAAEAFRRALEINPNYPEAHNNLGTALGNLGQSKAAFEAFRRAVELKPDFPEGHHNFGNALLERYRVDEAIEQYREAIRYRPGFADAHNSLGGALFNAGLIDEAITEHRRAIEMRPGDASFHSGLILTMCLHGAFDAAAILGEARKWDERHGRVARKYAKRDERIGTEEPPPVLPTRRDFASLKLQSTGLPGAGVTVGRKLRIGYVSPDFKEHVLGRNVLPLFERRDRERFEVFAYASVRVPDAVTQRFQANCDAWREIENVSDDAAAEMIFRDGIDVLVDLAVHSASNRLPIFARKPALVQVTFAGYPGTTGMSAMDYRLTDPYLDPPGENDDWYSERSIRLPHSFWCYDPEAMGIASGFEVSSLPALRNGPITFGSLVNFTKLNKGVLELWSRVLMATAGSRMMVMVPVGVARQRVLEIFEGFGVGRERIEFVARQGRGDYMHTYDRIDLCLDTVPYNGHTTSLDSLWMGVPVVTLVGKTAVGRAGLSQCSNLGLTELVAKSTDAFVRIATELAGDVRRLAELRRGMRERMLASPLTKGVEFTRAVEEAYLRMSKGMPNAKV
jgi:protein O-GlcNAc transferase